MTQQHHLNHATWDCKYHVVFIPKYRKKTVFGKIKKNLGAVFHDLARRRECRIEEGHLMPDHVHMLISIPPKYSVAEVIGFIKGKPDYPDVSAGDMMEWGCGAVFAAAAASRSTILSSSKRRLKRYSYAAR